MHNKIIKYHEKYLCIYIFTCLVAFYTNANADGRPEPAGVEKPRISPDGTRIVFESKGYSDDWTSLWLINRDGSNLKKLSDYDTSQLEPDWSPDGSFIVYRSGNQIWRMDSTGKNDTPLTKDGINTNPRFSPDGNTILFHSKRNGKRELWFMDADGNNQRGADLPKDIPTPKWSPDGSALVYRRCKPLENTQNITQLKCHIYTYHLTNGETQLTFGNWHDTDPDWGNGGIVFRSNRNGTHGLWVMDSNGENLHSVYQKGGLPSDPHWDPKGNSIIFSNASQLWVSDLHGSENQLTHIQPNLPPVAVAGEYPPVECTSPQGAPVMLDGSKSYDPNDEIITYFGWKGPFGIANGSTPTVNIPIGNHSVSLYVEVDANQQGTDTTVIEVHDTTPPSIIELRTQPKLLWPPDHKMRDVTLNVKVQDLCSKINECRVVEVQTNESAEGLGDGNSPDDWQTTSNLELSLRAERSATGNGRQYKLIVECKDESGNITKGDTVIEVPLNMSDNKTVE